MRRRCNDEGFGLMIETSRVRLPVGAFLGRLGPRSTQPFIPPITSLLAGVKAGRVHLCRVASNTV